MLKIVLGQILENVGMPHFLYKKIFSFFLKGHANFGDSQMRSLVFSIVHLIDS